MSEEIEPPIRIRKWRAYGNIVEIQHTRELAPLACDEVPVAAAVHAYSRTLGGAGAEGLVTELQERLQAIIDWADLAMKLPEKLNSHGVRNLDGPVFDAAREVLAKLAPSTPAEDA